LEAITLAFKDKEMYLYYTALFNFAREEKRIGNSIKGLLDDINKGGEYTRTGLLNACINKYGLND